MLRKTVTASLAKTAVHTLQSGCVSLAVLRRFSTDSQQQQEYITQRQLNLKNVRSYIFNGEHLNLARRILVNDFTARDEPMCFNISPRNFDICVKSYLEQAIKDQLSLYIEADEVFAGIVINNDFTFVEDDELLKQLKQRDYFGFDMILEIERQLNREFRFNMQAQGLLQRGNIMRMLLLAIDPHFIHRGFGTFLTEKSVERAQGLGYKYITAACTNDHMIQATSKCGFECVNTIEYDQWEYPKGTGIFPKRGIAEITGFKQMCFMVKKLQKVE